MTLLTTWENIGALAVKLIWPEYIHSSDVLTWQAILKHGYANRPQ